MCASPHLCHFCCTGIPCWNCAWNDFCIPAGTMSSEGPRKRPMKVGTIGPPPPATVPMLKPIPDEIWCWFMFKHKHSLQSHSIVVWCLLRRLLPRKADVSQRVSLQAPQYLHDNTEWQIQMQYTVGLDWFCPDWLIIYSPLSNLTILPSPPPLPRLCLSITDFHPDTWNPAWSVSTILTGLLSFMVEKGPTLGSIETSDYAVSDRRSRWGMEWCEKVRAEKHFDYKILKKKKKKKGQISDWDGRRQWWVKSSALHAVDCL